MGRGAAGPVRQREGAAPKAGRALQQGGCGERTNSGGGAHHLRDPSQGGIGAEGARRCSSDDSEVCAGEASARGVQEAAEGRQEGEEEEEVTRVCRAAEGTTVQEPEWRSAVPAPLHTVSRAAFSRRALMQTPHNT